MSIVDNMVNNIRKANDNVGVETNILFISRKPKYTKIAVTNGEFKHMPSNPEDTIDAMFETYKALMNHEYKHKLDLKLINKITADIESDNEIKDVKLKIAIITRYLQKEIDYLNAWKTYKESNT